MNLEVYEICLQSILDATQAWWSKPPDLKSLDVKRAESIAREATRKIERYYRENDSQNKELVQPDTLGKTEEI